MATPIRFIVTTYNTDCGFVIFPIDAAPRAFDAHGNTTNGYEQTMAVNAETHTLATFRAKYPADIRKEAICEFLHTEEDGSVSAAPTDYTVREWEKMLMEALRTDAR